MIFNADNHHTEEILKRILNKEELDVEDKTDLNEDQEANPYQEDFEKIGRYKDYIDLLNENYLIGLNQIQKEKDSKIFVDYQDRFKRFGKVSFFNDLEPYLSTIPVSNGSRIFNKIDKKVGIVCDEFLYNSYKDVVNLEFLPYEYSEMKMDYDFVIIATTWNGIDGSWKNAANAQSEEREHLYQLIEILQNKKIPVLFYSKEDPVNYELFKDIAAKCDFIYTSAVECVEDYIQYTNNEKVFVLEFGINPHYHNPVGTRTKLSIERKDEVIFAGSWIEKYPVRNQEAAKIFDAVKENETELTIFDRNLLINRSRYHFPARYIPNLTYPLSHENLQKMHKIFRWAINVNSVKYSETMFANRIYELQAFGNLLLSNYSTGVNNKFPNVFILNSPKDFAAIFNHYDERELNVIQAKGIRNVMRSETTYHRLLQIMNQIGIHYEIDFNPVIYVVADDTDAAKEMFDSQSYENKQLVSSSDFKAEDMTEGFVTYFKDSFYYEEYYLEDMISAFKYTDVDFVTKTDKANKAHDYSKKEIDGLTMYDLSSYSKTEKLGYALDMVEVLKRDEMKVKTEEKKLLSVIIPIHNNGIYLEDKCFSSLRRSSIFDKMEIIFINDGSTDPLTNKIVKRLIRQNPSIKYFEYESGSGSASRPRNKGAELASTPYITYLDPDNEATGDGYKYLLEQMEMYPDVDMVIGNILKEDNSRRSTFNYYQTALKYNNNEPLILDTHKYMETSGLRAQSIQALIIKSEIIKNNNIKMIEGAAGQDTMFFQELMLHSRNALVVEEDIHMYYAAVSGSVTNTVSKKFFDKYYKLEIERIPFLKKHKLLDSYMMNRFNFYIRGWYIIRLDRVKPEERHEAVTRFLDIYSLYDGIKRPENKDLDEIINNLKLEVNYRK